MYICALQTGKVRGVNVLLGDFRSLGMVYEPEVVLKLHSSLQLSASKNGGCLSAKECHFLLVLSLKQSLESPKMATRSLSDVYFNLRTEISRFKAYSMGDSAVRTSYTRVYFDLNVDSFHSNSLVFY
jgi:hypothetical protein